MAVGSKTCDVEEALRPVLGACGGAGVKVETAASGTIENGKLVQVMRQYTLGGWLSDVQAALATMDPDTVLPMDTDNVRTGCSRVNAGPTTAACPLLQLTGAVCLRSGGSTHVSVRSGW